MVGAGKGAGKVAGEFNKRYQFQLPNGIKNGSRLNSGVPGLKIVDRTELQKTIDFIPDNAKLVGRGMDFGYTNDPTTITDIWMVDNAYIFDERIYKTGLTNPEIWREFKSLGLDNSVYTIADSAEPKSIQELTHLGMKIQGAIKGPDSINFGIQKMQEVDFSVTARSLNLIKELRTYSWATDREGKELNKPIDNHNHIIDSIRYYFT